jgi:hypothetical protein
LCHQSADLQDSHLIPKAVYKHIRRSPDANSEIVAVSRKSVMFTDKQIHCHLLCSCCEDRFGQVEKWTIGNCLNEDGTFPFRDAVLTLPRCPGVDELVLGQYLTAGEIEKLAYFAVSVLWRAAVHTWKEFGATATVDLGSYEEDCRQYLLGSTDFPTEAALVIFVAEKADARDQFATTPAEMDVEGYRHYNLFIPGIKFSILIGEARPAEARAGCSLSSKYIYLDDHLDKSELMFQIERARVTSKVQDAVKEAQNHKV